jgi:hypothetical protein
MCTLSSLLVLYKKRNEDKVYKLRKALYGLKQAPQTWYSRIESYFKKEGYHKYLYEHALFIKTKEDGKMLLVFFYI